MANNTPNPLILAIDTSCDDTSAAVTAGTAVLSNVISSQTALHAPYGGVFPTVAKLAHRENIDGVVELALKEAGVSWNEIAAVAVTQGPGLAPALEVGVTKAKELSAQHHKPLIAVNHIEGHALSPLAQPGSSSNLGWNPSRASESESVEANNILSLVISGGHSEFILITQPGEYRRLGWTVDDAAGEVLDKIGRLIGLGYPAGAAIERCAQDGNPKAYPFPLPMTTSGDYNLSFAGLKTFARNLYEKLTTSVDLTETQKSDFCASFQYAIFRAICYKLDKILKSYQINQIWLGGGVAANQELRRMINEVISAVNANRERLAETDNELDYHPVPPLKVPYSLSLCADNAAMIGVVAGYQLEQNRLTENLDELQRLPNWKISS